MRRSAPVVRRSGCVLIVAAISILITQRPSEAANTVTDWTGAAGDSLWNSSGNWDNGVPGSNYAATFSGTGNGSTSITLNGIFSINTIAFSGSPVSYTIGTSSNDGLNFDPGGAITVASGIGTLQAINAAINTSGALTVTNSGTGGLVLGGQASLGGTLTVTSASGALTTLSGSIAGSGGVTPGGAGAVLFSGNNSYSGLTNLSNANTAIEIGSDSAFGTGILQPNNSTNSPLQAYGADRTVPNQVNLLTGWTITNAATPHNLTFSGPIALTSTSGRTLTFNNYGQAVTLGSASNPSTITLSTQGGINLSFNASNNSAGNSPATVIINDVIRDNPTPPATPDTVSYNSNGNNTPQGNVIINGANTYAGNTTFNTQSSGTFVPLTVELGVSSVVSGSSIVSGPFGKGTVTVNNSNAPPTFVPVGGDRTVANPLTLTSGFFAATAPLSGTGPMVDPTHVPHNLTFTGAISDPGRVITNNMAAGAALYLGSAASPSVIAMASGGTTKFQTTTGSSSTTIIYDQLTGSGANLTVQNRAIVQLANGSNSYSGSTSVISGGVLLAVNTSGSATGTSPVAATGSGTGASAVGSGGIVGGTGFITAPISISSTAAGSQGGILAPGVAGPGTLTVGSMTWNPYGRYAFEFNGSDNTAGGGVKRWTSRLSAPPHRST